MKLIRGSLKFSVWMAMLAFLLVLVPVVGAWSGTGHFPGESIGYTDGTHLHPYTVAPNYRQASGRLDFSSSMIHFDDTADLYVNFAFDTTGKTVYLVYTTDGSNPTKTNGTAVTATFSRYSDPNRIWVASVPPQPYGTTVKYIFYISNGTLATSSGRVSGTVADRNASQYETSWTESDGAYFEYAIRPIYYVDKDATGTGTGLSWQNAYTSLTTAIAYHTGTDEEIWVAEGVYYPEGDGRNATFRIEDVDGFLLYGGFAGNETRLDQRDWVAHPTILSGDVERNDINTDGNFINETWNDIVGGNAYNIFSLRAYSSSIGPTTVIDGFTLTGGQADGGYWQDRGGGLYCYSAGPVCGPTISHVVFSGNQATNGGGLATDYGITDGAVLSPYLKDVVFTGNRSTEGGGGLINNAVRSISYLRMDNVTFLNNMAGGTGGGALLVGTGDGNPVLNNVVFSGNQANEGGGLGILAYAAWTAAYPVLTNLTFSGNRAAVNGGAMVLYGNGYWGSQPALQNSILWGNTAGGAGAQIYTYNFNATYPVISYSTIEGGCPDLASCGSGMLYTDPLFIMPITATAAPTTSGNYRLRLTSPAIDSGDNNVVPAGTDRDGWARKVDMPAADTGNGTAPLVDRGAYEAHVFYVDRDATGTPDGLSWSTAYTNVQEALAWTHAHVSSTYEIWVAEGTYYPDEGAGHVNNALTETFRINRNNVQLYGGFAATETQRSERNWTAHPTILSGDIDKNGLATNNAYHVFYLDGVTNGLITGTTVIDGFTVTGGNAAGTAPNDSGGGIYCAGNGSGKACSPTLANLTISGNRAASYGGGLYNNGSSGTSSPQLTHVIFSGNQSASSGGGMYNDGGNGVSSPILTHVIFRGNQAAYGGGLDNYGYQGSSSPVLINVLFSGNYGSSSGGGIYNNGYSGSVTPRLLNVTFAGNRAGQGGAIHNYGSGSVATAVNTIFWGDSATTGAEIYNNNGTAALSSSVLQGSCPSGTTCGTGMRYSDPKFATPIIATAAPTTTGDYRLQMVSPAIDAGNSLSVTMMTDLDGNVRIVGDSVDAGAYESPYLLLNLNFSGMGIGNVTSNPAGINCGITCTYGFLPGTVVTLTATPLISSTFSGWSGDLSGTGNPQVFTMTTAKAVTASFAINTYTITPTAGANGSLSPAVPTVVNYGSTISFTISPSTGYHIVDVWVDGSTVGAVSAYTFTNVTANHTITAAFAINIYTITPTAGANGSISPSTPQTVNHGGSAVFTISPSTGYHIVDVRVDGSTVGAVSAYTFTNVTANHTITAAFAINTYTIMPTAGTNGSISPSTPQTVNHGGSAVFTISPSTGYHIVDVRVDGSTVGAVSAYTFTNVTANHTITAAFAINIYTITPTAGANGSISPSTPQTVNHGGSAVFTISPSTGYHIVDVRVDGSTVGAVNAYTFTNVMANHTITAAFAMNLYTLTVTLTGEGTGLVTSLPAGVNCSSGTCQATFTAGTVVTLSATTTRTVSFGGWSGAVTAAVPVVTVTMDGPKAVTATFRTYRVYLPAVMRKG